MAAMKTIGEALEEMLGAFSPRGHVQVPLLAARGLVSAIDVTTRGDLPGFDNSAMDGYAVHAADVAQPGTELPVVAEIRAGGSLPAPLAAGAAARIFTGAPLPAGADAVVIQEHCQRTGDRVRFQGAAAVGANVRRRGSDLAAGSVCVPAGTPIDAGEIGMLASQGYATLTVARPPRVAIVATGDELRELGEPLPPGTIVNSNAYTLAAAVESTGAQAWMLPIARDHADAIATTLQRAFDADVVLCSGGVSVGDYDLVADALARLGVATRFHKVAMKPGKPLLFALRGATPFLGLPGNPVSSWVAFEVFVRPCLRHMLGHRHVHPRAISVTLSHAHQRSTGRVELARARFHTDGDRIVATLAPKQGSGSLPSLVAVDGLVILPAEQATFSPGEQVRALVLHENRGQPVCALP